MMNSKTSMIFIAAALFLTGCAITVKEQEAPQTQKVRFSSEVVESKTSFTEPDGTTYPVLWTDNDESVLISLNKADAVQAQVSVEEGYKKAWFAADISVVSSEAPFVFYSVSPASSATAMNKTHGGWSVNILSEQTPSAISPDERAQILVGSSKPLTVVPEQVEMYFKHLTAYGKFSLNNLPEGITSISSVELIAGAPIVGQWFYNVEEGTMESNGASSTVTIKTSSSDDIWFACAPQDLSGKTLEVIVTTDNGLFGRTITLPEGTAFKAGKISTFTVDMAKAEPIFSNKVYRLVTSVSALSEGDNVIITQAPSNYSGANGPVAISTSAAAKYINPESVTVTGSKASEMLIENPSEKVQVYTVSKNSDGLWAFKGDSGYLNSPGEKSVNHVALPSEKSYWELSIDESSGEAKLISSLGYYLRYNASSPRFTTYRDNSGVKINLAIYKESVETVVPEDDPFLSESVYGAYLASGNKLYSAGTDQLSNEYGDSDEDFIIIQPSSETVITFGSIPLQVSKGRSFNLSFTVVTGRETITEANYSVSVVKEDGPKLWLSDGAGNGFIVKK